MAFMWRGVSSLTEKLQSHRHLKYLVIIPLVLALAVASYKIGLSSGAVKRQNSIEDRDVLPRERRGVTNPPIDPNLGNKNQGGAVYIRWGRTACPDGTEMIYGGVTGGSWFNQHGGGSNPLCLPMEPIWGRYNEAVEKASKLYGAEYESPSAFNFENTGGTSAHDHNIPCVVCRSETKRSVVMVPGRNLCYSDWKLEYNGYLMTSHPAHNGRSQFICMDGSPESDPAGFRDENGALFYNVEGVCGSLPCPPYVQRREITCSVCTK